MTPHAPLDAVMLLVALVVGAVAGAWAATFLARRAHALARDAAVASSGADARARLAAADATLVAREAELRDLAARVERAAAEATATATALADERVTRAGLEAALADERGRATQKAELLAQARDDLARHFKALASETLELNRQRLAEQHVGALDLVLKPLGDKLSAFEKKVEETYDREAQQRSSLRQEVLNLQAATLRINEDANNLTRALKGEAKTRGDWGEVVLERVLERSGLVRGVEYVVQQSMRDAEGGLARPDVVIRLPDDKHVVIDSKVSLVAYDRYYAASDAPARATAGDQHVRAMREHAKALEKKNYQAGKGLDSPDFVAMFVPIEPAFHLASSLDDNFFLDAWNQRVVIVTPSTLLAFLMTVQSLWQRDKQTRNAIAIAAAAGGLHDQFARVVESLHDVGKQLGDAQRAFDRAERQLVEGPGNVVRRLRQLKELGARVKRPLPPDLLRRAGTDDDAGPSASRLTLVDPASSDGEVR